MTTADASDIHFVVQSIFKTDIHLSFCSSNECLRQIHSTVLVDKTIREKIYAQRQRQRMGSLPEEVTILILILKAKQKDQTYRYLVVISTFVLLTF